VLLRFAPAIGLLAALAPAAAHAQVNIDQGKSAAQIFANDCAACHKATRGLANGRNSLTLASFLREHYTASREQAAALAAYVLGAAGGEAAGQKPGQKPGSEHAKVEEPKATEPRSPEPKTAAHPPPETAKPESEAPAAPATAKLQSPEGEGVKPEEGPSPGATLGPGQRRPLTATRGRRNGLEAVPPTQPPTQEPPAAVVAAPATSEAPSNEPSAQDANPTTSAAAPAEQPSEDAPVPRDNIPD
jgi:hypothetical protein